MSDLYTELLVQRKTPASAKILKVLMIVATVFAGLLGFTFMPLALVVFVGMIILCYFKLSSFDLEFEYLYVNGELDVDKIMSKTKRKRVASIETVAGIKASLMGPFAGIGDTLFTSVLATIFGSIAVTTALEGSYFGIILWNICKDCESFECVNSCYYNAFKLCAKPYTVDELVQVIKRDSNNC